MIGEKGLPACDANYSIKHSQDSLLPRGSIIKIKNSSVNSKKWDVYELRRNVFVIICYVLPSWLLSKVEWNIPNPCSASGCFAALSMTVLIVKAFQFMDRFIPYNEEYFWITKRLFLRKLLFKFSSINRIKNYLPFPHYFFKKHGKCEAKYIG